MLRDWRVSISTLWIVEPQHHDDEFGSVILTTSWRDSATSRRTPGTSDGGRTTQSGAAGSRPTGNASTNAHGSFWTRRSSGHSSRSYDGWDASRGWRAKRACPTTSESGSTSASANVSTAASNVLVLFQISDAGIGRKYGCYPWILTGRMLTRDV